MVPLHAAVASAGCAVGNGPLQPAVRHAHSLLRCALLPRPLSPSSLVGSVSPNFALDFAGILSVNGKRQSARRGWYVWTNG